MQSNAHHAGEHTRGGNYGRLLIMMLLSFAAMFGLMYAMVDRFDNVYANINQVYMAALMAAPMVPLEIILMRGMYPNGRKNMLVIGASVVIGALCFAGIRRQTAVADRQFVRSMIPHHAGAILMCGRVALSDAELQQLCRGIIAGQQKEIDQMKATLERLQNK